MTCKTRRCGTRGTSDRASARARLACGVYIGRDDRSVLQTLPFMAAAC